MFVQKIVFSQAVGCAFRCKDMGFLNSLQTHQMKIKVIQIHNHLIISLDNSPKQDENLNSFNPSFPSFLPPNLEAIYFFSIFAATKFEKMQTTSAQWPGCFCEKMCRSNTGRKLHFVQKIHPDPNVICYGRIFIFCVSNFLLPLRQHIFRTRRLMLCSNQGKGPHSWGRP